MMPATRDPSTTSNPRVDPPEPTPQGSESQAPGYQDQHGSGASAHPPARPVPGPTRTHRAVPYGGGDGTKPTGARKRLAASALSPDPKVSEDSDTAKLKEMVLASIPKEVTEGVKEVKSALELAEVVKSHATMLQQHAEAIRILRGTAMEQDNRLKTALVKLNLTVAATDKLDDAVELVEADQAAVVSDFKELKNEMQRMREVIETKEVEQDAKLLRLVEQRHIDVKGLTQELEGKMSTVEATFVKVEAMLYTMDADRKKYDQLIAEMQVMVTASGPTSLPDASNPAVRVLQVQMERMGREIAELNGSVCGVRQAVGQGPYAVVHEGGRWKSRSCKDPPLRRGPGGVPEHRERRRAECHGGHV